MPTQHTTDDNQFHLLSELESNNAYFDSIVNMIPTRLYVAGASGDDPYNPKYLHGQHKESREARKARNKLARSEKFDPEKMESTVEAKRRLKKEEEDGQSDDDNDSVISNVVMSDDDGEDNAAAANTVQPEEKKDDNKKEYASRIEMLRAKLHAKMAEKSQAQPSSANPENVDTSAPAALVSKRAARRAEKRKRKDAAVQRNKKRATSVAETKSTQKQRVVNLGGSTFNAPSTSSSSAPATSAAQDLATIDYQSLAGLKPKLDGALNNKSLATMGIGGKKGKKKKSLEHLLADAESKEQRLRELKKSGAEEDKEKAKNIEWGEALKVAGGSNIRKTNDTKLLKKAIKRKGKKKSASAKAWNVRLDQAKDAATKKQSIRNHNLDQRKLGGNAGANLSSKRINDEDGKSAGDGGGKDGGAGKGKRRRQGPHSNREGFEGKKSGFINGGGGDGGGKE